MKKTGLSETITKLADLGVIAGMVFFLSTLMGSEPAEAQQWIEFEDRLWGFSINFPHEPMTERIDYTTFLGETVPARRYYAERGSARYTLTVVYFSHARHDAHTAISFAAEAIRDRGTPTYYSFADLDGIPGQMLSVTEPGGRIVQASVYFVDQRLYIAEGSVAAGEPAPSQFMQTILIIDPEGERIILDPD